MNSYTAGFLAIFPFALISWLAHRDDKPQTTVTQAQSMGKVKYSELGMTQ